MLLSTVTKRNDFHVVIQGIHSCLYLWFDLFILSVFLLKSQLLFFHLHNNLHQDLSSLSYCHNNTKFFNSSNKTFFCNQFDGWISSVPRQHARVLPLSLSIYIYIYIRQCVYPSLKRTTCLATLKSCNTTKLSVCVWQYIYICVCVCVCICLFNGISTFLGYFMPNPSF